MMIAAIMVLIAANFVTPEMLHRRGLTDAQYEYLWSIGRNPQIEPAAARDWIFRASRYQNVTNWLNLCGRTNDFARLSYALQGQVEQLNLSLDRVSSSNSVLHASLANAEASLLSAYASYTNAEARVSVHSNRLARVITFLESKRDSSKLSSTKAIYQAIIDKFNEE